MSDRCGGQDPTECPETGLSAGETRSDGSTVQYSTIQYNTVQYSDGSNCSGWSDGLSYLLKSHFN